MSAAAPGSAPDYDVAIVGLGPVGAFTALLLAEAGLRVVVLERSTEHVEQPRAVGLDGETLRAFQRIGLGDAVQAIVQPPRDPDEVCFTDSKHQRLFGLAIPRFGHNGWRDTMFFDQPELEALLRQEVGRRRDRIDVFLGDEVVALDRDAERVVLRSQGVSGARRVTAAFAIGCDGASSFVRRALGIEWQSLGYDQDWLVVDILQTPEARLPLATMQVCDPARLTTYVCVKDPNRRWEFQLLPGETREEMLRPARIEALLSDWLPPEHYTIRRAAVYQFHAATAARWQVGRAFLAGDAAHQTPPFLGQGLNAGFRDSVNLGWKIPLVRGGVCDASLLESYAAERDAHARDLVDWAVAIGKLMETLAAREAGLPDPHPQVDQSAGYGQGRSAPPLRDGVLVEDQIADDSAVGSLLRQPTLCRAGGDTLRLDDVLGRGFAVIGREAKDLRLGPEAASVLARLGGRAVSLEGFEVAEGEYDRLFDAHPAVVLRPDRYVFGVVDDAFPLDRLLLELGRKLALRGPVG
jgi:3-(3-hydroxy-phenyl)propionate hydroxylase